MSPLEQITKSPIYSMGPKKNCLKCQQQIPGHFAHLQSSTTTI